MSSKLAKVLGRFSSAPGKACRFGEMDRGVPPVRVKQRRGMKTGRRVKPKLQSISSTQYGQPWSLMSGYHVLLVGMERFRSLKPALATGEPIARTVDNRPFRFRKDGCPSALGGCATENRLDWAFPRPGGASAAVAVNGRSNKRNQKVRG
jgi:hypothetical protein